MREAKGADMIETIGGMPAGKSWRASARNTYTLRRASAGQLDRDDAAIENKSALLDRRRIGQVGPFKLKASKGEHE
jgi:hypothetical protein